MLFKGAGFGARDFSVVISLIVRLGVQNQGFWGSHEYIPGLLGFKRVLKASTRVAGTGFRPPVCRTALYLLLLRAKTVRAVPKIGIPFWGGPFQGILSYLGHERGTHVLGTSNQAKGVSLRASWALHRPYSPKSFTLQKPYILTSSISPLNTKYLNPYILHLQTVRV